MTEVAALTVGIATMDRPEGLANCLDAILEAHILPQEVIVVDQGRTLSGREVVAARVTSEVNILYVPQEQRGLSRSRNTALQHTTTDILAVIDDDCVPDASWIAAINTTLRANPRLAAVTGRVLPLGPEMPGHYAVSSRASTKRTIFQGRTSPWHVGTGGNCAVRTVWLRQIGAYDERLGTGSPGQAAEDMDLFYRLLRAGAKIQYEPDALVYHERQPKERRLASRSTYGFGIGCFCGMWLRRRDAYVAVLLRRWFTMQGWGLVIAILRGNWEAVRERILTGLGTVRGLLYGLRQPTLFPKNTCKENKQCFD